MSDQRLYRFYEYCGRMGELEGVFVSNPAMIDRLIGKRILFYEVLGKHSQIWVDIRNTSFEELTDNETLIDIFKTKIGQVGVNPIDHYDFEDEPEDEVIISEETRVALKEYYERSEKN